jgi:hypothetical protein
VPEGSVIEALVEVLPGAKIDDNGGITINGKSVKKFKLDGRDFMTGNNQAVMKNLPSYPIHFDIWTLIFDKLHNFSSFHGCCFASFYYLCNRKKNKLKQFK